ncbi:MAG: restriction endonuclease subunit S [Rikenellaceae bacterium]
MSNNIPQGYKESPLGVIPQDWEVRRLGEVCRVNQGLQIPIEKRLTEPTINSYKYITIQYLNSAKDAEYIINPTDSVICCEDDVLMTRTGNTGIVVTNVSGVFHNNFFKINFDRNIITKNFLVPYLRQDKTQHQILVKAGTSTIPDLNHKDFYSIYFPIPPLAEQERIAEVLGTWDVAIEKQGALVDALTRRKRALMQQLLAARKRLPNFSTPWQDMEIRDVATEIKILNKKNDPLEVLSCTKHRGLVPSMEYFGKQIFSKDVTTYKVVPINHFAYATNHIEEGSIGYQDRYTKALISPMYTVFKTVDTLIDNYYFYALLKSHLLIYKYAARMEGSIDRRGGLRWDSFSKIKITIPLLKEQKAISKILTTADREIELATTKLNALRTQKRALMQQLLTGKKRLKI